jgi:hypothetical protein
MLLSSLKPSRVRSRAADCGLFDSLKESCLVERHEILEAVAELKLYGMRASFDEIAGKGPTRRDEIFPLLIILERQPEGIAKARTRVNTKAASQPWPFRPKPSRRCMPAARSRRISPGSSVSPGAASTECWLRMTRPTFCNRERCYGLVLHLGRQVSYVPPPQTP